MRVQDAISFHIIFSLVRAPSSSTFKVRANIRYSPGQKIGKSPNRASRIEAWARSGASTGFLLVRMRAGGLLGQQDGSSARRERHRFPRTRSVRAEPVRASRTALSLLDPDRKLLAPALYSPGLRFSFTPHRRAYQLRAEDDRPPPSDKMARFFYRLVQIANVTPRLISVFLLTPACTLCRCAA